MSILFRSSLVLVLTMASLHASILPEAAKIDEILAKDWEKRELKPNPIAPDEVFLRRVYVDVAGRIPTLDEAKAFLSSQEPNKRMKLIDQLLGSDGYASNYYNYFADILRLLTKGRDGIAGQAYGDWLKTSLRENKRYDVMVKELLTTDGAAWDSGAIGFYTRDRGMPLDHLAATVQVFLGTRIECAQCHNHPFDKWTQMDYYQMAAFTYGMDSRNYGIDPRTMFGNTGRKNSEGRKAYQEVKEVLGEVMKPLRYTAISPNGKLPQLPHDYQYDDADPKQTIEPKTMFGHDVVAKEGQTMLQGFGDWMTSPENPRFTTVIANRLWKRVMGMGLIEPVDEITDSTVASNPELMSYLEKLMIAKNYNLKSYLRVLLNADVYQRMPSPKDVDLGEEYFFTGPLMRRMSAEQIWDSVVTLLVGNVDTRAAEPDAQSTAKLAALEKLYDSIAGKTGEEILAAVRSAQDGEAGERERQIQALRAEMNATRENDDPAKSKSIAREIAQLQRGSKGDAFVTILGEEGASSFQQMMREAGKADKKPSAKKVGAAQVSLSRDEIKKMMDEGMDKKDIRAKVEEMKKIAKAAGSISSAVRASELESPAPRGHFLRTFGQSDRETIENANDEAAVPQALKMLNGPVASALMNPVTQFSQSLAAADSDAKKADAIYLSLLTRLPTRSERQVLDQVVAERGDEAPSDIVHALLNTSEFLFVR